jgi:hypothetical protein
MSTEPPADSAAPGPAASPEQQALNEAVGRLATSVARLAVARGLPYAAVEAMLKQAFVDAAAAAHPQLAPHRRVSRIATATGINRREVTRLTQPRAARSAPARGRSLASELFAHWRTQPPYVDAKGAPRPLPRQGPEPSFETLAQCITRDVHPRSLLDELVRLGLAELDAARDEVSLLRDAYVPRGDRVRMLELLGDNVGDHLAAAVDNVLDGGQPRHFEQALWAGGLAPESIAAVVPAVQAQWKALLGALVPMLEAAVERDGRLDPAPRGRVRLGLFSYHDVPGGADASGAPTQGESQ